MDGVDCLSFNLFYPGCNEIENITSMFSSRVGTGVCDGYPYNSTECSYDGGDCI